MSRQFRGKPYGSRRGGHGHPSGLTGKEIGMYYAKKQRAKSAVNRDQIEIADGKYKAFFLHSAIIDRNSFRLNVFRMYSVDGMN